jgi:2-polyprenyl-6-methoxyphenol hydroxylase-like FAD-dependent oxidoreductase
MPGRVLIVGGGICGLTLGIALRQKGFPADLVELRPDLRQQSGIGLSLQGNSVAALARIGVAERCVRSGVPANHIDLLRADGALVAHQPLIPMGGPDFPGTVGISRNELHAILLDAAETSGVAIRTGVSVDSFSADPTGVSVRFTDGRDGSYDLMVAADGAYSGIRAKLFPHIKPTFCGQAVWRAGVPRPKETVTTELYVGGPFGIVGICPISADEAYIYIVESAEGGTRHPEADLAALMIEKLEPYSAGRIRECAAHLPASVGISYRPLDWLLLPPPWNRDRVVVIGDAAHCNPPVLAQGAAMGIEDAVVLAESLADEATIELALEQFTRRRVPRASLVVNNSVQLCEWEVKHLVSPKEIGRLMTETQQALAQPF